VQVNYLQQIQNFNGPPEKEFSIAAKIAELRDSFSALSDVPDDSTALEQTVYNANIVADKFNDYAELLTTLRNDSQADLQTSVNRVNGLLKELEDINLQIRGAENFGNSVASLQDQRDIAIKSLTEEIDITFFERADGVLVVQTRQGQELVGDVAHRLEFDASNLSAMQYYPASAAALELVTTTNSRETRADITQRDLGGKIGGLMQLRDEILPSYHAQLDELAFQMANRMDQQGLRLFTDQNGNVPSNAAPNPSTVPPTPVDYVDFARNMQVNTRIVDDPSLLQRGTYASDSVLPTGDNAIIRRVLEFAFGEVNYQQVNGTTDLTDGGANPPLQTLLGLSSSNSVVTGIDFSTFTQMNDPLTTDETQLLDAFEEFFPVTPPATEPTNTIFELTFEDARLGLGPDTVQIDLNAVALQPGANAMEQLVNEINAQLGAVNPALNATATSNTYGQLVFESSGNITVNGSGFANAIGDDGMAALGIQQGTFQTVDPSFTVQVGNNKPYTISIEPGDTITELQNKLIWNSTTQTGVPGLSVDVDAATGGLILRPGIDDSNFAPGVTNEQFGADLKITGASFSTLGSAVVPDNINIVSALFGSFTAGPPPVERSPITNITHRSEISNGSGTFTNFRNRFLGPNAGVDTGIFSAKNILDYAQKIVDETSQDYNQAQSAFENEDTLRGILQREFSNDSGVNIDEEMSNLIVVQTAYAAAARAVTAADEMFQELINSIRR
jgi:flagellar hook-associated protein 1 FlgK